MTGRWREREGWNKEERGGVIDGNVEGERMITNPLMHYCTKSPITVIPNGICTNTNKTLI